MPNAGNARRPSDEDHPDREPWRDRRAHHACLPRDGHRHGRDLLGRRSRGAPRALRGPGLPARRQRACRHLPAHRQDPRDRPRMPAPTPCIPATASSPRTRTSRRPASMPGSRSSAPRPAVIARMGSKTAARDCAMAAGAPVVPGTETPVGPDVCDAEVQRLADAVGYPLMVKAVAGGGGKGMREVRSGDALLDAVRRGQVRSARRIRRRGRVLRTSRRCGRVTSKSSCSPTSTAPCSRSSSASVRCSAATRR